nr:unnamed protein product [Digitaria exilis]
MDRYQRVEKPREEAPIGANEIRITAQGRPRNYITYALNLLQDNSVDDIVIKAMGKAINKTVVIVELLKRPYQVVVGEDVGVVEGAAEEGSGTEEETMMMNL